MTKPVTAPTAFSGASPPWSLTSLDANFTNFQNTVNDLATYSNYLVDTSPSANTFTVATAASLAFAYSAGIQIQVKVNNTNTSGTVNINVNGLGNQLVKNADGTNPVIGQFVAGGIYGFQYDGTNFQTVDGQSEEQVTSTATVTGCTTAPTTTVRLTRHGNNVLCVIDAVTATSNATTFTLTSALPAAYQPARAQSITVWAQDNGADTICSVVLAASSGTLAFGKGSGASGGFTNSGTKGLAETIAFTYMLN